MGEQGTPLARGQLWPWDSHPGTAEEYMGWTDGDMGEQQQVLGSVLQGKEGWAGQSGGRCMCVCVCLCAYMYVHVCVFLTQGRVQLGTNRSG